MTTHIRQAVEVDVARIVELSEQRRIVYQTYQPVFWRKAQDSVEKQTPFLTNQLSNDDVIALVYEDGGRIKGFVIANVRSGKECNIDDYCVDDPDNWATIGRALLEEVGKPAQARGVTDYVVVCGHLDQPKRAMLQEFGLSVDSYWFTSEIEQDSEPNVMYPVRDATFVDIPQMSQLSAQGRTEYPEIERDNMLVPVCEASGEIQGYAIALNVPTPPVYDPGGSSCLVIEFVVKTPDAWPTVGKALLDEIGHRTSADGAVQQIVMCDYSNQPMQQALNSFGLTIASEWYKGKI